MAALNKSRLSLRTNAALKNPLKNYAHFFPRARFKARRENAFTRKNQGSWGGRIYFTLVARDSDSGSAYYLFVARLHLERVSFDSG